MARDVMNMMLQKFKRVCIIGLGHVGLPTAEYMKRKGLTVFGYDISKQAVLRARNKGIMATTRFEGIRSNIDTYVICVSTTLSGEEPDLTAVFDACEKISKLNYTPSLLSIESTIIPGTSRKVYNEILAQRIAVVHVPHRYWSENPINYGVRQLRVIGAVNYASLDIGLKFYRSILDIPLHIVSSVEVAEMCKIAENAYRYVCIAFVEELMMVCEELGLDFKEVREACNTKWNITLLEARDGIGGHCLPKDIKYLASLGKYNTLLRSAILVDKQYRNWLQKKKMRRVRKHLQ